MFIGGHNLRFDLAMLAETVQQDLHRQLPVTGLAYFDSSAIEKAMLIYPRVIPGAAEDPAHLYQRLNAQRVRGIRHSLQHCLEKYGLKADGPLHEASTDAAASGLLCHKLIDTLRAVPEPVTTPVVTAIPIPHRQRNH